MIELVADRGFDAVSVSAVAKLAGVSRRAFYREFECGEDCLVDTYELVVRCAVRAVLASQVDGEEWRGNLRRAIDSFCEQVAADPAAARLGLLGFLSGGPAAVGKMCRTYGLFGTLLTDRCEEAPDGPDSGPFFAKAVAPGVSRVARLRLAESRAGALRDDAPALAAWVEAIAEVDRVFPTERDASELAAEARLGATRPIRRDDVGRIISAAEDLAAERGGAALTSKAIAQVAGVSNRRFESLFASPGEALLAALDRRIEDLFALIDEVVARERSWERGLHLAIEAICRRWATDGDGARLWFVEALSTGPAGIEHSDRVLEAAAERLGLSRHGSDEVAVHASLGAVWAMAADAVMTGRLHDLRRMAPGFSFILLAPIVGAEEALSGIGRSELST